MNKFHFPTFGMLVRSLMLWKDGHKLHTAKCLAFDAKCSSWTSLWSCKASFSMELNVVVIEQFFFALGSLNYIICNQSDYFFITFACILYSRGFLTLLQREVNDSYQFALFYNLWKAELKLANYELMWKYSWVCLKHAL